MTDVERLIKALASEREAHKATRTRFAQGRLAERLHKEREAHAQTRSVLARALADLAALTPSTEKD